MFLVRPIFRRTHQLTTSIGFLQSCHRYSSSPSAAAIQAERTIKEGHRNDWTRPEVKSIYDSPILDLLFHGAQVHRHAQNFREVQQCTLLSVKTGGCSEDCSYCPQSSRYDTGLKSQRLMNKDAVIEAAKKAKEAGSTRFCMGAAWRDTIGRKTNFNQILEYVKEIRGMGMEVCCTLGMLEKQQAVELKQAGLTAYNHNLDTSREYYPNIITTRTYDERLKTLEFVRDAGINVCSGGIIGLGEAEEDRVGLLHTLSTRPSHPETESVPINALVAVKGTPLEDQKTLPFFMRDRENSNSRGANYAQNMRVFSRDLDTPPSSMRDTENLNARNDNDGETEKSYRPMGFVRGVIDKDGQDPLLPYYINQRETGADYVHIKMLRNNTFVTVTDSKGNIKLSGSVGSVKEMKSGQKLARYAAEATAEVVGRRARGLGLKAVVMKVNGFTHFRRKRQAIMSWLEGFLDSRADKSRNPVVHIEDTTRKPHNGCRLPKKRRI